MLQGKWRRPMIKNPAFKGVWKARMIPNPDHYVPEKPLEGLAPISAVGIELWTMSKQILFGLPSQCTNPYSPHVMNDFWRNDRMFERGPRIMSGLRAQSKKS